MKKLIFIAVAVLMLSSCVRDNFITNYVEPLVETIPVTVLRHQWQQGNNETHGVHYFFDVPNNIINGRLTNEVFRYGIMQAFALNRDGLGRKSPLPFSDFFVENGVRWEEHITVEFAPQRIIFILKNDDQVFEQPFFDEYRFVVRFLW